MATVDACNRTLAALVDRIEAIADTPEIDRRRDLVQARREIAEWTRALDAAVAAAWSAGSRDEFRHRMSRIRHALALHQATFPAVLIDDKRAEYREGASAHIAELRALMRWVGDVDKGVRR